MNEIHDDNGQFKMRLDDDVEDTLIPAQVDDMRIEKLNHKMTLITIILPVLIVVVLVIAYLDIKKRVVHTEDTGTIGVQNLSEDLDSRFSSLSLRQAQNVEDLARLTDQTNQSMAKVQVNLKKLEDSLKKSLRPMVNQKDMKATAKKIGQNVANVSQSVEEVNARVADVANALQALEAQIEQARQELVANKKALSANKSQMTQLEENLNGLDQNKIDKSAVDLAIKLEALRIKQSFKSQLDELDTRLITIETRPVQPSASGPAAGPKAQKPSGTTSPENIEEQTIAR